MKTRALKTVDVFTEVPFKGNPVAVVLDATGLTIPQMQAIASWTNLSETTFVVPVSDSGADYQVRIFTPTAELPFAGHPTIGTAHALLEAGLVRPRRGVLRQQCQLGLINIHLDQPPGQPRWLSFELPPARITALNDTQTATLIAILGVPMAQGTQAWAVDVGPRWVVVQLGSAEAVIRAAPDLAQLKQHDIAGCYSGLVVFGPHPPGHPAQFEVRAFAPAQGVNEDPVCGSGNGAVAAVIQHTGQTNQFGAQVLTTQGQVVGRAGQVRLAIASGAIRVGGMAVTCINGTLTTPS